MPLNNASYIFVIGGWDANLDYVNVVEVIIMRTQIGIVFVFVIVFRSSPLLSNAVVKVFKVNNDGTLERYDHDFTLPSDRFFFIALTVIKSCKISVVIFKQLLIANYL